MTKAEKKQPAFTRPKSRFKQSEWRRTIKQRRKTALNGEEEPYSQDAAETGGGAGWFMVTVVSMDTGMDTAFSRVYGYCCLRILLYP